MIWIGSLNTKLGTSNTCQTGTAICATLGAAQRTWFGPRTKAVRQTFLYVPLHFLAAHRDSEMSLRRRGQPFFAADRRLPRNPSQVAVERRSTPQAVVSVSIRPETEAPATETSP
jgi:hypothetical protein